MRTPNPSLRLRGALALLLALGAAARAQAPAWDTQPDTWAATDALGRALPLARECGPPRAGKTVGIFYFLWMQPQPGPKILDLSKILAEHPEHPAFGPPGAFHWWGEPLLGYYASDDECVIRKHAQMLTDAGVDVVIFDVTNALTYDGTWQAIGRVYQQIRREGGRTPQFAFICHSHYARTVRHLYDALYAKNLFSELWFRWQGRPLLLAPPGGHDPEVAKFFAFRESWAWSNPRDWFGDGRDKWPWLDHCPQQPGWHEDPKRPEQIVVGAAQHPVSNYGRSFHDGREPPPEQWRSGEGAGFAEQWKRALAVDPEFVFITGWNEWIAQRFVKDAHGGAGHMLGRKLEPGDTYFVDTYSPEFSRDLEPMKGGFGDNYYWQMAAGIRRYKGARAPPPPSPPKSIAFGNGFADWKDVGPEYRDAVGDTSARAHGGFGQAVVYTHEAGRNDLKLMKVARDPRHVWFYAQTAAPISPRGGTNAWMLLLIRNEDVNAPAWEGYHFIVTAPPGSGTELVVKACAGGGQWREAGRADFLQLGNEMAVAIPRALLGLPAGRMDARLRFKWADSIRSLDPLDWWVDGDVAPDGRFQYVYEAGR
jgi:hypothetical protein